MKKFFAKHTLSIAIVAAAVVSIGGAIWYVGSSNPPSFTATTATLGNVVESIDEPTNKAA